MSLLKRDNVKEFYMVSFIMALALVLRLYTIGDRSLWMDEIWQVNFYYSESIGEVIHNAATKHAQAPLDYIIGYMLMKVFPFSETIVRLPAAIFGTLTVYLVYLLIREIYSRNSALIAAILTALSSHLIQYSQEARPYMIFIFFLLMMLYFYFRAIGVNSKIYWSGFGISLYLLLLTRGFEPLVAIIVINILTFLYFRFSKNTLLIGAISIIDLLLYFPFFSKVIYGLQTFGGHRPPSLSFWQDIIHRLQDFPFKRIIDIGLTFTNPFSWLFFLFALLGYYTIFTNQKKTNARIFSIFAMFMPFLHVLIYTYKVNMENSPFYPRYYIYILPFIYIITAVGIEGIWQFARVKIKRTFAVFISGFLIFILIIAFSANLYGYYTGFEKDDWRGVSDYIKGTSGADNFIVTDSPQVGYGRWKPKFEGKYIYYKDAAEYSLNQLVDHALSHPDYKGDIFLVLYYHGIDSQDGCCKELCRKHFYNLCVYKFDDDHKIFIDRVEALIDKMITEYPHDGSRVGLYLNKIKILKIRGDSEQASRFIKEGRQLVPPQFAERLEQEIKEIK